MTYETPHEWIPSPLGHGNKLCTFCHGTDLEIAAIGNPNHCPERHEYRKAMDDASMYGTGIVLNGKHKDLHAVYVDDSGGVHLNKDHAI